MEASNHNPILAIILAIIALIYIVAIISITLKHIDMGIANTKEVTKFLIITISFVIGFLAMFYFVSISEHS